MVCLTVGQVGGLFILVENILCLSSRSAGYIVVGYRVLTGEAQDNEDYKIHEFNQARISWESIHPMIWGTLNG
jgi:hypothetical protein